MDNMIIKETTVWGDHYKARNMNNIRRLYRKQEVLQNRLIDHPTIYAYKPKNQRGPARENQTFIVSYVYYYEQEELEKFIEELAEINLSLHIEPCTFRDHEAHRIIVYENKLPIENIIELL